MRQRPKMSFRLAALAAAALLGAGLRASAAIIGTCTIVVQQPGTIIANPAISTLASTQSGGSAASVSVTTNSLLCTLLNLLDCYGLSAPAPASFLSAPSGGDANVSFSSTYTVDGVTRAGGIVTRLPNGTKTVTVDLAATKSTGIFPAGAYQAEVTVRCE